MTKWISVKDQLPEEHKNLHFSDDGRLKFTSVLCVTNGVVNVRNRLIVRKTGSEDLDESATNGWVWSYGDDPTHWMPLPDPPKTAK